jgi:hypothetical protein
MYDNKNALREKKTHKQNQVHFFFCNNWAQMNIGPLMASSIRGTI